MMNVSALPPCPLPHVCSLFDQLLWAVRVGICKYGTDVSQVTNLAGQNTSKVLGEFSLCLGLCSSDGIDMYGVGLSTVIRTSNQRDYIEETIEETIEKKLNRRQQTKEARNMKKTRVTQCRRTR